jgi:hypothetical protein
MNNTFPDIDRKKGQALLERPLTQTQTPLREEVTPSSYRHHKAPANRHSLRNVRNN